MAVTKVANGDRVRRGDGATGTIVDTYAGKAGTPAGNAYGVLPDRGPRESEHWEKAETVRTGGRIKGCTRCGDKSHHAFYCPVQDTTDRG